MMMMVSSTLGWTASPLGHTTAPAVAQGKCVLKEDTADNDVLTVLVRTLERIEAKIDYLEGKVDNLGAQGLEKKWQIERLEGKVWLGQHTGTTLFDPLPRGTRTRPSHACMQVDYLGSQLLKHFDIPLGGEAAEAPTPEDD